MNKKIFSEVSEKEVTQAILEEFLKDFKDYIQSDVIIIGGGPSGLMAGRELAKNKLKTLIVERNNYLGGGFWVGGYMMNKVTFRSPSQEILDELKIPYKEYKKGLYVADGPHACSKLISAACEAGVKIASLTILDDVILKNNQVKGVVVNWAAVHSLPKEISCLDPIGLEARFVIDATGHDEASVVKKLAERGLLKISTFAPMNLDSSEDLVVENTKEVYPGVIVTGMSAATTFGLPRMGPTFGAMLLSGKRAAEIVLDEFKRDFAFSINNR